jgi:hypothetical protein
MKISTHRSTLGVEGLASTFQDLSRREDMLECYLADDARSGPEHLSQTDRMLPVTSTVQCEGSLKRRLVCCSKVSITWPLLRTTRVD